MPSRACLLCGAVQLLIMAMQLIIKAAACPACALTVLLSTLTLTLPLTPTPPARHHNLHHHLYCSLVLLSPLPSPTHSLLQVCEIDPKWLVEMAPRFFKAADPHKLSRRKRYERIEPLYDR